MDDIRKNILQQREMQKARLRNHFAKAFNPQESANGKDIDYAATQGAKEVKEEVKKGETAAEEEKVKKVMDEFKEGELHSGSKKGKKVTNRKQAVAIALSEAGINKAEIGDIEKGGDRIWNGEEWVSPEQFLFSDDIEKARTSKYKVGDVHPNGKWVWTEWAPGKFDWKSKNGKHHKGKSGSTTSAASQSTPASSSTDWKSQATAATIKNLQSQSTQSNAQKSTTPKVDTETIDQAQFDRQYKMAMKAGLKGTSMGVSLMEHELNNSIKKLEETLQKRPGAKSAIKKLQEEVTKFATNKKALEKALEDLNKEDKSSQQGSSTTSQQKAKDDNKLTIPASLSKIDIRDIPDKEYKSITYSLEHDDPDDSHVELLYFDDMTDKEVANFLACAKYFKNSSKINKRTQERCKKWENVARTELLDRIKKQGQKKSSQLNKPAKITTAKVNGQRMYSNGIKSYFIHSDGTGDDKMYRVFEVPNDYNYKRKDFAQIHNILNDNGRKVNKFNEVEFNNRGRAKGTTKLSDAISKVKELLNSNTDDKQG